MKPREALELAADYPVVAAVEFHGVKAKEEEIAGIRSDFCCSSSQAGQIWHSNHRMMRERAHLISVQNCGLIGVYVMAYGILLPAPDLACPALDVAQARCTIYERRPMTCRIFPLNPGFPHGNVSLSIKSTINTAKAAGGLCDDSAAAPVLVRPSNGKTDWVLVNPVFKELEEAIGQAKRETKEAARAICASLGFSEEGLVSYAMSGMAVHSSVALFKNMLLEQGVSAGEIADVLSRQVEFLAERAAVCGPTDPWKDIIDVARQDALLWLDTAPRQRNTKSSGAANSGKMVNRSSLSTLWQALVRLFRFK